MASSDPTASSPPPPSLESAIHLTIDATALRPLLDEWTTDAGLGFLLRSDAGRAVIEEAVAVLRDRLADPAWFAQTVREEWLWRALMPVGKRRNLVARVQRGRGRPPRVSPELRDVMQALTNLLRDWVPTWADEIKRARTAMRQGDDEAALGPGSPHPRSILVPSPTRTRQRDRLSCPQPQ